MKVLRYWIISYIRKHRTLVGVHTMHMYINNTLRKVRKIITIPLRHSSFASFVSFTNPSCYCSIAEFKPGHTPISDHNGVFAEFTYSPRRSFVMPAEEDIEREENHQLEVVDRAFRYMQRSLHEAADRRQTHINRCILVGFFVMITLIVRILIDCTVPHRLRSSYLVCLLCMQ